MIKKFFILFFVGFFYFSFSEESNSFPPRPYPFEFVVDYSESGRFLEEGFRRDLSSSLEQLARQKGTQVVVVIREDLAGIEASQYAIGLLNAWELGIKQKNNAVLILIKPKTEEEKGKIFIATGYGMEGDLPDILIHRIIEEKMIPFLKEGKPEHALAEGIHEIVKVLHPEYEFTIKGKNGKERYDDEEFDPENFFYLLVMLFILWLFFRLSSGRGIWISGGGYSGGGWFSGSSGGGSFSDFGGRGGGGGAGGQW
jgi:uncharacterized protein